MIITLYQKYHRLRFLLLCYLKWLPVTGSLSGGEGDELKLNQLKFQQLRQIPGLADHQ